VNLIFKINRLTIIEISFILIIGLISLTWFRGLLINTSDFVLPLDREKYFLATLSIWDDRFTTGFNNPLQIPNMLFGLFSTFTQKIGIPLLTYEMIIFYIWFAGSGISAYIFSRILNFGMIARISSSLIYMINPYALVLIWGIGQGQVQIEYTVLPLIIGLFIHGIINKKSIRYILGLQLLWFSLGLFGTQANVQLTLVYWVAIFIIFISYSLHKISKHDFSSFFNGTKFLTFSIIFFGLLNFYWLIPTIPQLTSYFQHYSGLAETAFSPNIEVYIQNSVFLNGAIRLMGYWAFNGAWQGGEYYTYASSYSSYLMIIISFLIPAMVILGIRKLKSKALLLIPLYFAGLFLIKGVHSPLGWINEYVFINFSLFQTGRNVIMTWGLLTALCTSLLFGLGVGSIYEWLSKHSKTIKLPFINIIGVSVILFLVIGLLGFPFFTGDIIRGPSANFTTVDARFEVPEYYYDFEKFIESEQGDFRILALPLHKAGNGFFNWTHGYVGPEPLVYFSNNPVVYSNNLSPMFKLLGESFGNHPIPKQSTADILSMLQIKFIVVHEDSEWNLIEAYRDQFYFSNLELINDVLDAPNIEFHHRIGKLAIYENTKHSEKIFVSTNLISLSDKFESIKDILPLNVLKPNSIIFSEDQAIDKSLLEEYSSAQIINLDNNSTSFYLPHNSRNDLFFYLPGIDALLLDDNMIYLYDATSNLLNSTEVFIWSANATIKDSLIKNDSSFEWKINFSSSNDRNFNIIFDSIDLSGKTIEFLIDGDGSNNPIAFQLYDNFGNHIGWNHVMDWEGVKRITLSLNSYDYSSSSPSLFQMNNTKSIAIYYYSKNINEDFTKIIITSLFLTTPSTDVWSKSNIISISGGQHELQLPEFQTGLGKIMVISSKEITPPHIDYEKLSPNEYRITVNNASSPFYLYFGETFDQGWKVYDENLPFLRIFSQEIISDENHFLVNGFANAWFINQTGTFSFTLYHSPQAFHDASLGITIVTFLLMVIIVFYKPTKYFLIRSFREK